MPLIEPGHRCDCAVPDLYKATDFRGTPAVNEYGEKVTRLIPCSVTTTCRSCGAIKVEAL